MSSTIATWEDEDTNRHIQFSVEYTIENDRVEIGNVTPNKVSFVCPTSNTVTRAIGVHTNSGRSHLVDQIRTAGKIETVVNEIANREGLLASA